MSENLLRNGGFESDWSEEHSHSCLVFPADGTPYETEVGNIFTPPGWTAWYRHEPGTWGQPEVRDAWITGDSRRVHSGQKGLLLFTFFRKHDGGLLQQVETEPGTRLRVAAWAHAWSNHRDPAKPDLFPHPDDPLWSEGAGVGYDHFYGLEGQVQDDGARNFTFQVGIDPGGGTDPYADTVVWGQGAHIYNAYRPVPPVEVVAQADTVTVFLRSRTLWPFKHNDAYWDDIVLEAVEAPPVTEIELEPQEPQARETVRVTLTSTGAYRDVVLEVTAPDGAAVPVAETPVEQPPEGSAWRWTFVPAQAGDHRIVCAADGGSRRLAETTLTVRSAPPETWGLPRTQYARTYVLLPPDADAKWVQAVLDSGAWERHRWTIGGSGDDAGIGALEDKTVIAVNPGNWQNDLRAFFQKYYPRTRYVPLEAATPDKLRRKLREVG